MDRAEQILSEHRNANILAKLQEELKETKAELCRAKRMSFVMNRLSASGPVDGRPSMGIFGFGSKSGRRMFNRMFK